MNAKAKLYHLTSPNFRLPFHIDKDRQVMTTPAQDIPMLSWPDGRWCLPANVYMLELYDRGLSRKNHGGTLLTYAANISHLLRYCYDNKTDFPDLTYNQFAFFIKTLQGERRAKEPELYARDANSVIAIGRNCLDFLASAGRLYQDGELIGPKGRIRAEQKEFEIRTEGARNGKGTLMRKYWHHRSFPTPDPKNKRLPISSGMVDQLRRSVESASGSMYQRKRRYAMLKLLEMTGGRRSEIAALTVESVYEASRMQEAALKLMTAKKPGGGRNSVMCRLPAMTWLFWWSLSRKTGDGLSGKQVATTTTTAFLGERDNGEEASAKHDHPGGRNPRESRRDQGKILPSHVPPPLHYEAVCRAHRTASVRERR